LNIVRDAEKNNLFCLLFVALKALSIRPGCFLLLGQLLVTTFAILVIGCLKSHSLVLDFYRIMAFEAIHGVAQRCPKIYFFIVLVMALPATDVIILGMLRM